MPSSWAPSRSMAARLWWFSRCVRNSGGMGLFCWRGWGRSRRLHWVFSALRCTRRAYQVPPISRRWCTGSRFIIRVMPTGTPCASSTANGSTAPASRWRSSWSMGEAMASGDGTAVYQSFHSSPSREASTSAEARSADSGTSDAWVPARVTGESQGMRAPGGSAVVLLHEDELLEERHVLLVLQQRAHERRHGDLVLLRFH